MSDQHTDPPADPDTEQTESVDARFSKIEAEQAEQGGKLDQILARLPGTGKPADKPASAVPADADPATIAEQVRRAVEAVGAEKEKADADSAHAADHAALKEMREKPPRETTGQGWRGKLQRAMYGGDPK